MLSVNWCMRTCMILPQKRPGAVLFDRKDFVQKYHGEGSEAPVRKVDVHRDDQVQTDQSAGGKMVSCYNVCFVLLFAASCSRLIRAQGNFSLGSTSCNCWSNLICLGDAHKYAGDADESFAGRLSLIQELGEGSVMRSGIAYYNQPVRMLDLSTRKSASFKTSFVIDEVPAIVNYTGDYRITGDGLAFVISADNSTVGESGALLGFFGPNETNNFKSIVVEFDNFLNGAPEYDISDNHVSFDFKNITYVAAANASDVDVLLWNNLTTYAWVEYSAETQQLELRISDSASRPISPLLSYTVDLFDVVEEYMWVGFSGGTGDFYSYYYIGDWTFESYGIPLPLPSIHNVSLPTIPVSLPPATPPTAAVPKLTKGRSQLGMVNLKVVAIAVGIPVLLGIIAGSLMICFFVRKRAPGTGFLRRQRWSLAACKEDPMLHLSGMPERFSYKMLSVATGGFSEESKLGQGGFGSVYRGVLPTSGTPVAVKKISGDSKQGEKEFMAEVSIISQLRHRNLIHLMGWCKDRRKYLLVYELMPNGSLDKALFRPDEEQKVLSWSQRLNIVTGTAAALDYLHQGWKQQVIHRDIKASNIMLDDDWNAKLGDFGLARLVDHQEAAGTTMVAGTYGYIAPEAVASGRFTEKTDVFAFGAVALEVACGRTAFARSAPLEEIVLVDWVWQHLSEGNLLSVVDRRLAEYDTYWMEVMLLMGLLCSHPDPMARPSIRHVVQVLAGDAPVPSVPESKPATAFSKDTRFVSINDLHIAADSGATSSSASGPPNTDSALLPSPRGSP